MRPTDPLGFGATRVTKVRRVRKDLREPKAQFLDRLDRLDPGVRQEPLVPQVQLELPGRRDPLDPKGGTARRQGG